MHPFAPFCEQTVNDDFGARKSENQGCKLAGVRGKCQARKASCLLDFLAFENNKTA
jgi:hypothetical protein